MSIKPYFKKSGKWARLWFASSCSSSGVLEPSEPNHLRNLSKEQIPRSHPSVFSCKNCGWNTEIHVWFGFVSFQLSDDQPAWGTTSSKLDSVGLTVLLCEFTNTTETDAALLFLFNSFQILNRSPALAVVEDIRFL